MDAEEILVTKFRDIKSRGWIETKRHDDQCLGNAFEDLIGKEEDNKSEADFMGIELKSHRIITSSLVSLFSKSPSFPRGVNTYLRETYGVADEGVGSDNLILNTTMSGNKFNNHRGGHKFKADVNREDKKIYIIVEDLDGNRLEDKDHGKQSYWKFDVLETALQKKLAKIAILYGEEKDESGKHYVKYSKMTILEGLTLEKMLSAIEIGDLYIDIRLGVYASGPKKGKTHDHGTGFRINLDKLLTYGTTKDYE